MDLSIVISMFGAIIYINIYSGMLGEDFMIKNKNIAIFALSLLTVFSFVIPARADYDDFIDVDLYNLEVGDVFILEGNNDQDYTAITLIDVESAQEPSLFTTGDSGWSGGTPPSGNIYYFKAERKETGKSMTFDYILDTRKGYTITDAYNPAMFYTGRSISSLSLEIGVKKATSAAPARASLYWSSNKSAVGLDLAMRSGYLTIQVSSTGRMRMTWKL